MKQVSDAAKRCSDIIRQHLTDDFELAIQSWVAIRMSDGGSDGVLYPLKALAVRNQLHEYQCCYVRIPPTGMSPEHSQTFLDFHRKLYDAGMRMADPDMEREVIMPDRMEHI